jgi:hypothetical protein
MALSGSMGTAPAPARPARNDALAAAVRALGADTIRTLQFTGAGATVTIGQNFAPDAPWPRVTMRSFTARIDYETPRMELEVVREMSGAMPRGGGVPFTGTVRQRQAMSGALAWNVPMPPDPTAGSFPTMPCTPPEAGGTAPKTAPAPDSRINCLLMMWAFPQGFLKAALTSHASLAPVAGGTEVSFLIDGRYKVTGVINSRHEVERVRTWMDQSLVGDMLVETEYAGYRDVDGVRFPSRIRQTADGFPSLEVDVASVTANAAIDIVAPPEVHNQPGPVATVVAQARAVGVVCLTCGTHHWNAFE